MPALFPILTTVRLPQYRSRYKQNLQWKKSATGRKCTRPENLFYALLKLQDKIDQMSLAKRPTEVRLDESMVENFRKQIMIAQTPQPR